MIAEWLRAYTKEIKLDGAFADTGEWAKNYSDLVGRSYKTVFPDGATNVSYFNAKGELWKRVDADGNITLATNLNFNESYRCEPYTPTKAARMPPNLTLAQLLGYERDTRKQSSPTSN